MDEDDSFNLTKRTSKREKAKSTEQQTSPHSSHKTSQNVKQVIPWLNQCLTRPESTIFDMKLIAEVNQLDASQIINDIDQKNVLEELKKK